jgi:hypothetical protein
MHTAIPSCQLTDHTKLSSLHSHASNALSNSRSVAGTVPKGVCVSSFLTAMILIQCSPHGHPTVIDQATHTLEHPPVPEATLPWYLNISPPSANRRRHQQTDTRDGTHGSGRLPSCEPEHAHPSADLDLDRPATLTRLMRRLSRPPLSILMEVQAIWQPSAALALFEDRGLLFLSSQIPL